MSVWTVKPTTRTVPLTYVDPAGKSRPFEIVLKRHLNIGEQRNISTAGWQGMRGTKTGDEVDARIDVDWQRQTFARTEQYLVSWTLKEDDGTPVDLNPDVIRSLNQDVYGLIEDAITAHIALMEQEKKAMNGTTTPSPTSA